MTVVFFIGTIVMMTRTLKLLFAIVVWGSVLVLECLIGITAVVVIRHTNTHNHFFYEQTRFRMIEFDAMVPILEECV